MYVDLIFISLIDYSYFNEFSIIIYKYVVYSIISSPSIVINGIKYFNSLILNISQNYFNDFEIEITLLSFYTFYTDYFVVSGRNKKIKEEVIANIVIIIKKVIFVEYDIIKVVIKIPIISDIEKPDKKNP